MVLVDGVGEAAPDWIVVQAYRKPFINLLWFGIMLISVGFVMSIFRRVGENRFERERGRRLNRLASVVPRPVPYVMGPGPDPALPTPPSRR